ncbi:MAG: hypothetical protein AAGC74_02610 [Verrucomicrobiota bacterium]
MVGLAKELEGQPFRLIASYCQRGTKEAALASLRKHGWSRKLTNATVMYQTDFPKAPVKYVPYYLIFDHKGELRHNHMAGPYHGGNRKTYQTQIKALLKQVPTPRN